MKPIEDLIRRWADTLLSGNLSAHMGLYAPTLDWFNGSSNVNRETVRTSKIQAMNALKSVRRFEMFDLRFHPSRDGSVNAEFRIDSDTAAGAVPGMYKLRLRRIDTQWRICGEESHRVISRR